MAREVQGLAEAYATLDGAPAAAREELGVELAIIGREILTAQKAAVPKATGELEGALSLQLLIDKLRVQIGLLIGGRDAGKLNGRTRKARDGGPFYGRIVEFGRRAQTVLVTRRLKRRVKGNGRNGTTRRVIYEGKPYRMRVKAMAARPYVQQPLLAQAADLHLGEYWSRVLARAEGA